MKNLCYAIGRFDKEGDLFDECVTINLENGILLRFDNIFDLDSFIEELKECSKEIKEDIYKENNNET